MSELNICNLINKINKYVYLWEVDGPTSIRYWFSEYYDTKTPTFLTVQVGEQYAMFQVMNNGVLLVIGNSEGALPDPWREWLVGIITRNACNIAITPYLSTNLCSVPPVILFNRTIRDFFDNLNYLLTTTESQAGLTVVDVERPNRTVLSSIYNINYSN